MLVDVDIYTWEDIPDGKSTKDFLREILDQDQLSNSGTVVNRWENRQDDSPWVAEFKKRNLKVTFLTSSRLLNYSIIIKSYVKMLDIWKKIDDNQDPGTVLRTAKYTASGKSADLDMAFFFPDKALMRQAVDAMVQWEEVAVKLYDNAIGQKVNVRERTPITFAMLVLMDPENRRKREKALKTVVARFTNPKKPFDTPKTDGAKSPPPKYIQALLSHLNHGRQTHNRLRIRGVEEL